jgi:transposase
MKAYSQDLRERVVRACDEGRGTRDQLANLFGVSTAWIRRLLQRRRQTGSFAAKPHAGGRAPKLGADQRYRLVALVADDPDATLAQLHERLRARVHLSTIHRALAGYGLTVKKKSCTPASKTAPTCGDCARGGGRVSAKWTRGGSCSSMRSGRTRP